MLTPLEQGMRETIAWYHDNWLPKYVAGTDESRDLSRSVPVDLVTALQQSVERARAFDRKITDNPQA